MMPRAIIILFLVKDRLQQLDSRAADRRVEGESGALFVLHEPEIVVITSVLMLKRGV